MSSTMSTVEKTRRERAFSTQDINGATLNEDYVTLANYEICEVIINVGNSAGTSAVTLKQATDNAGTGEKALGFVLMSKNNTKTTVSGDTFNITGSDDNSIYVIPIEASELDVANDFKFMRVDLTDPSAAMLVGCHYALGSARYSGANLPDPTS